MEGCKKDQKISTKLLNSIIAQLEQVIPDIARVTVVACDDDHLKIVASHIPPQSKKKRLSSGACQFQELLDSLFQLVCSIRSVAKNIGTHEIFETMHLQTDSSMVTLVLKKSSYSTSSQHPLVVRTPA